MAISLTRKAQHGRHWGIWIIRSPFMRAIPAILMVVSPHLKIEKTFFGKGVGGQGWHWRQKIRLWESLDNLVRFL